MFNDQSVETIEAYLDGAKAVLIGEDEKSIHVEVGPIKIRLHGVGKIQAEVVSQPSMKVGEFERIEDAAVALRAKVIEYRNAFDRAAFGAGEMERIAATLPGLVVFDDEGVWEWVWCPDATALDDDGEPIVCKSIDLDSHGYRSAPEAVAAFAEYQTMKVEKAAEILRHASESINKGLAQAVRLVATV